MKKLLMALAIFGMTNYSAKAQTKERNEAGAKSKFDLNYPVCTYKNGYNVCTKAEKYAQVKALKNNHKVSKEPPLESKNQVIFVRCQSAVEETPGTAYRGSYRHHNIIVNDNMDNPYKGKDSKQYDGPAKNEERNINVNQSSIALPPNSGYVSNR